jgi:hypothetical protein
MIQMQVSGIEAPETALDQFLISDRAYHPNSVRPADVGSIVPQLKAKPIMSRPDDIAGTAALAICESLLLALNDHNILPEKEIVGILKDAAAAHEYAPAGDHDALHAAVAALINGILAGGNSVRRH